MKTKQIIEYLVVVFFICLICAAILAGKSFLKGGKYTPEAVNKITEVCGLNDGLWYVDIGTYSLDVYCVNGAVFEINHRIGKE